MRIKICFARERRRNNRGPPCLHVSGRDDAFPRLVIRQRRQPAIIHSFTLLTFRQSQPAKGPRPFTIFFLFSFSCFFFLSTVPFTAWQEYPIKVLNLRESIILIYFTVIHTCSDAKINEYPNKHLFSNLVVNWNELS